MRVLAGPDSTDSLMRARPELLMTHLKKKAEPLLPFSEELKCPQSKKLDYFFLSSCDENGD